jgi:Xaa-Pro aminopeptidase
MAHRFFTTCSALNINNQVIGVEPTRFRYLELKYLQDAVKKASFVSAEKVLNLIRIQKDQHEINAMRQAAIIAQNALQQTLGYVKLG